MTGLRNSEKAGEKVSRNAAETRAISKTPRLPIRVGDDQARSDSVQATAVF
jgi:hypothetical protein